MSTAITLALFLTLPLAPPAPEALAEQKAIAKSFLDALVKKDYAKASEHFDATMRKVLPVDKLETTWKSIVDKLGPLQKQAAVRVETGSQYDRVFITCEFEKQKLDVRVVFDKEKLLSGFQLVPTRPAEFAAPPYAQRDAFREESVIVGKGGDWPLPGTLALPSGNGPFSAVILLHGSGPNDRDETIGPNKPLRDLAWGLASQGIAVLRYEKRTREHGAKFVALKKYTLQEETIDDARAAVALLRANQAIDKKRIFVAGHSLGALAAPRLGEQEPELAGLILMAGNSRPLEDLIIEQFTYIYSLKGEISADDRKELDKIKKQVARVKAETLSADTPTAELPLGVAAPYWLDLRAYHPAATAAKLQMPLLVLQGERDYQVTMADFDGWKKALTGRANVQFVSYPNLNHLFMEGVGKGRPEEYEKPGHVAKQVVDEVANWVKAR